MNPVYSRDECVAAIRDYYAFLASMFMDPDFIVEPPQDGWPSIDAVAMQDFGKTDEVVDLLRHLPYITRRRSERPFGLPGARFMDWPTVMEEVKSGRTCADNQLGLSEGGEKQFWAKIPAYCIGLVCGGLNRENRDMFDYGEVILLDTSCGVVYWMNCPPKVQETAFPQPSYLIYPLEAEENGSSHSLSTKTSKSSLRLSSTVSETDDEEDDDSVGGHDGDDDGDEDDEEDDDDDEDDDDEDELQWGPCWPVRHFFEMLKNQFRELNFMARSQYDVCDIWSEMQDHEPPPQIFIDTLQGIYRKHGWPDLSLYKKDECLKEIGTALDEKFPEHRSFFPADRA